MLLISDEYYTSDKRKKGISSDNKYTCVNKYCWFCFIWSRYAGIFDVNGLVNDS